MTSGQDVYSGDSYNKMGQILIQPICLPPYGPVDPAMIQETSNNMTEKKHRQPYWYRDGMPLVPFEDMDCEQDFTANIQVPKPVDNEVNCLQ